MPLHPRETMDDVTEVSSGESIEATDTLMVTRNVEVRSKTFGSIIGGLLLGIPPAAIAVTSLPRDIGATLAVPLLLLPAVILPLLVTGTVHDRTRQVRYKRLINRMRSKNIEGQAFYPNSDAPEDLLAPKTLLIR